MSKISSIRLQNITERLNSTDIFAVYRNKTWIPVKGLRFDGLIFGDPTILGVNLQVNGSITDNSGNVRDDINDEFLKAQNNYYTERTYNASGYVTQIDTWESVSKATKLFTKVLTYTSDYLTNSVLTDEINSKTLTKTWTYNASNQITNSTRAYT